ncbi:MAG: hypothetical protein OJF62_002635 [Pseudolabrys sp.]|jgi:pimeloyl-[acyl-carrier protein] methyl ester esterase|nr:hypothetical protein [Pseudolabrys sp.]
MRALITGSGSKIVLVHGWAASAHLMCTLAAEFDRSFECHCIDLPGHGASVEGRVDVDLDEMVAGTAAYVRGLNEPVVLLGWAMGALISLAVAAQVQVRGLVCIGTPSGGAEFGPAFEKMAGRLVRDWPRYVRSSVDAITGGKVSPEMHEFICSIMRQTPPSLARRTLLEVAQADLASFVEKVEAPTLVLHGEQDKISPVAIAGTLGSKLRNAKVKLYPEVGHAPFLEHRDETVADIRSFLESLHA